MITKIGRNRYSNTKPATTRSSDVAPLRAALNGFRGLVGLVGRVGHRGTRLGRHTRSSVPSARVYINTPTRMISISTIDSAAAAG